VVSPGKGTGVVSGGNLATLSHLLGTPYSPLYKGCIFVMEDTGEALYRIDRMLFQMKWAGCFQGISGVVLGRFQDCGKYETICDIVGNLFEDMKIPILGGFDIGHGDNNITIPMGIRATLDTDQSTLLYQEAALV
jgi:muramoyltetrapeptide carboxypeptidase